MAPIKLGIIGYGFSTKVFHLPFIQALPNDFEVVAFFQRTPAPKDPKSAEKGSHCTVDYPDVKHYTNADEFFADKNIDCVLVCSKHDTHSEYAEKALNAGKHVSVEKPFTRTSEEADQLIALAKEKGKVLTVFQNRRWDNDFLTLKKLMAANALGDLKEIEIHYDVDFPSWMRGMNEKTYHPGDGMTFGLGSHTLDQAIILFGKPATITGWLKVHRGVESEVEDSFTAILTYDPAGKYKDLLVTVKTIIVSPMKDQPKYFARGTKGTYVKHGTCIQEAQAMANPPLSASEPSFGHEPPRLHGELTTKGDQPFSKEHQTHEPELGIWVGKYPTEKGNWVGFYEALRDAVNGKSKDEMVKPEESRDGIRLIELIRESSLKGQTVKWH